MKFCTVLAVLAFTVLSASSDADASADAAASDVGAKRIISLTTSDMLRLVSTADRAKAYFHEARRRNRRRLADQGGGDVVDGERNLRFLTGGGEGGDSCKDKLDGCRADLDACQSEADSNGASYLYVQMAQTCKIKQKTDGKGNSYFELSSKDMDDDTYSFADRPLRDAVAMPTKQFVKDFDATFDEETGGRPNAAVTFRHADTENFEGPLIAVFVEAAYRKDSGKYVYELTQSKEQEKINALKDFFREGDGKDDGVVEYEMCSIFIDSGTCDPRNYEECGIFKCASDNPWKDGCKSCMCYDQRVEHYCDGSNNDYYDNYFREKGISPYGFTDSRDRKCVKKPWKEGSKCNRDWQCPSPRKKYSCYTRSGEGNKDRWCMNCDKGDCGNGRIA